MFYVYILISQPTDSYYIGYTTDIAARLLEHNNGKVSATKAKRPWKVFYIEEFTAEKYAVRRERQLKSWKSRAAIERLKFGNKIEDPRFHNRAKRE